MTGPFASTGRQIEAAVKLVHGRERRHGRRARKSRSSLKDDTGAADTTKRLAQELIVNDGAKVIAGFGLTPLALAAAPIATQAKVPEVVMAAGLPIITERSPFIVRTSFTCRKRPAVMAVGGQERIEKVFTRGRRLRARP